MRRALMSGNEAVARGSFEAGCRFATGYPGTPSTEILENIAGYEGISTNWAVNEKVALETASGACLAGARSIVTMKHVGLNVASDPLMTLAYTGVGAGLVVVSADDPGIHSSQNEQDNRWYALMAKIPMLEPSDSEEARLFTVKAFEISELFDLPVLLRITTRISHSRTVVFIEEPVKPGRPMYPGKETDRHVMVPANARTARLALEGRLQKLARFSEQFPLNRTEKGTANYGIITSGVSYQYVKEVVPDASVLKLSLTNPLPVGLIKKFTEDFKRVLVVEELDPYMEMQVRYLSPGIRGKAFIPSISELTPEKVRDGVRWFVAGTPPSGATAAGQGSGATDVIGRPPILCPGCPHRSLFYQLSKQCSFIAGDMGCYTLAYDEPLKAVHTCLTMGAGIGQAMGIEKAMPEGGKKPVAVIGDSTFLHSGMTELLNVVYNRSNILVVILDNRTTAMTGAQPNPLSGTDIYGNASPDISLERIVRALGVHWVETVDPSETRQVEKVVKEAMAFQGPAVVVTRAPCVLLPEFREKKREPYTVRPDLCTGCTICLNIGCPSLWWEPAEESAAGRKKRPRGIAYIDPAGCTGCGLCADLCSFNAIVRIADG
ncbi:MAG: indolepyruvate ferredoxin oxidoreductase subunit alpha [Deltaproteobacteria bacterium]|nr:indolepyruvate ferredoxin oxidoreductase subunit alpha [Deltaproteobacteria bacterium]MCL5276770.1 indolepyruvate ferredoxin oxidoreductase subunit alpha [Deltaproteobacteria bacterium]